jgi:TonB family protein
MRDAQTPLLLWICAAVCAHYMFAEGGAVVGRIHEDNTALLKLAQHTRDRLRYSEQVFEVTSLGEAKTTPEEIPSPPSKPPEPPLKVEAAKPLPKAPEPAAKPKEEKKKPLVASLKDEKVPPPPALPPPLADKRIAVKQHAKKDQKDNTQARFLAEQANHVDEESVATQTSHDQDDPSPTPGGNHAGPQDKVGDSDRTKIADSENHAGEQNRAPGERGTEFEPQKAAPSTQPQAAIAMQGPKAATPDLPRAGGDDKAPPKANDAPLPPELAPSAAGPSAPDVTGSSDGTWSFNPIRPVSGTGTAKEAGPGQASPTLARPHQGKSRVSSLGLGGTPGPGQVNLNLTHTGVVATVGLDQLHKEREADGERRRSEHRGAWAASGFERWRSAIENYVSSVKPGNQTALNTAQSPFATYLTMMHNRIHPIFAETFLGSLENLPRTNPLNDPKLLTTLEIVLSRDGRLAKMGIVRTSGVTAFDIAALDSVQRASPFGPAPNAIISPDGNVYLHWQFHRDEVMACSTMNARPFLLSTPPRSEPVTPEPNTPPTPSPSKERGVPPTDTNEVREGWLSPKAPASRKHAAAGRPTAG